MVHPCPEVVRSCPFIRAGKRVKKAVKCPKGTRTPRGTQAGITTEIFVLPLCPGAFGAQTCTLVLSDYDHPSTLKRFNSLTPHLRNPVRAVLEQQDARVGFAGSPHGVGQGPPGHQGHAFGGGKGSVFGIR